MELLRHVSREFATGDTAVLHLEARSGTVMVEGRPLNRIEVDAEVHIWSLSSDDADEAARLVDAGMEQDRDGRLIVRAPALPEASGGWSLLKLGQRGSRIDYRLRVPVSTSVRVLSRSGRVDISAVHGSVHSEVISGRSQIRDVRGDTTVVSRSGTVDIERIEGPLTVEARSGRVRVDGVRGDAVVESKSGTIAMSGVSGDLRITARSGTVSVDAPGGAVYVRSRCGPVRYRGAVKGDVDIEVSTGPIGFAAEAGEPFFIDAEARVGAVTSDLPPRRDGDTAPTGGPRVRLRTHTGPIHIKRAD